MRNSNADLVPPEPGDAIIEPSQKACRLLGSCARPGWRSARGSAAVIASQSRQFSGFPRVSRWGIRTVLLYFLAECVESVS
jgi:hypothetical protein